MGGDDCFAVYSSAHAEAVERYDLGYTCVATVAAGAVAVASEAERRLLEKLMAVPVRMLHDAMQNDCECCACQEQNAEAVREALLAAITEGE
jgi:hypothetical protein